MTLICYCDNCNRRYTLEEYSKLEIVYTTDDRSSNVLVPKSRRCSYCKSEIKA